MAKSKIVIIISVFLFCICVLLQGCLSQKDLNPMGLDLVEVVITRVIDGDTAYARFPGGREEKVRFIGVDAPEINHPEKGVEPFGYEAEVYTRNMIEGERIWLEFDVGERDQYDRLLAYLWLSIPSEINDREIREKMFNARLLIEGYAVQVIFQPNVKYVDYFFTYNQEAEKNRRGLWGLPDE